MPISDYRGEAAPRTEGAHARISADGRVIQPADDLKIILPHPELDGLHLVDADAGGLSTGEERVGMAALLILTTDVLRLAAAVTPAPFVTVWVALVAAYVAIRVGFEQFH